MRVEAFRGMRYDDPEADSSVALGVMDISSVVVLASELEPRPDAGYSAARLVGEGAGALLQSWTEEGIVSRDSAPSVYIYRSGRRDEAGLVQGCGVLVVDADASSSGVEAVPAVIEVDSPGLEELCTSFMAQPLARATDSAGVHHRLWSTDQVSIVETVAATVSTMEPAASRLVAITPTGTPPPVGLVFASADPGSLG